MTLQILESRKRTTAGFTLSVYSLTFLFACLAAVASEPAKVPKPRAPEPIEVSELPLPPTAPGNSVGACTAAINPHGTGCIDPAPLSFQSGSFLPDGHRVLALVHFIGAPLPPDAASAYDGGQIILVKTDGTRFPNGDAWHCVTCGVPADHRVGVGPDQSYPQAFLDGKRILEGTNIVDCSPFLFTDPRCTPERVHIYPIRWNVRPDGSGPSGNIRELRLHPDNVHLGFNSLSISSNRFTQFGYIGRLEFNPSPKTGEPLAPRYELTQVTRLFQEGIHQRVLAPDPQRPSHLRINLNGIDIGEFRGFSKNGREVFYVGYPFESSNIDLFAADLGTGKVRRLTANPEYADPLDASPDDKWIVVEDTRGSGRQMFLSAMSGIPPITDLLTSSAVSSVRNNHDRRFFQAYLLDRFGDRGDYQGQLLTAGDGKPGSVSDPNWNAMADPRWSADGTRVVFWQAQVVSPACGGSNPLPCPPPTEPGGRRFRMLIVRFTSRKPLSIPQTKPISDSVPWGTAYVPGTPTPTRPLIPEGTYSLPGSISGSATATIVQTSDHKAIRTVTVKYDNYSDQKGCILNGTESVSETRTTPTTTSLDWHSDIIQTGKVQGTKRTGPDGFKLTIDVIKNIFQATGTLTTTINGQTFVQPGNDD